MNAILPGQLTYNKDLASWTYTPLNKLTKDICCERNKIQSRTDYYLGRTLDNHTFPSNDLEEIILWVENNA